ncbi:type IV toxin-antitoxin system AbiEi family antitoxin [Halomonas sp. DP8Y7-3]|uniref:type IV toxin-antitoxin system AbiEi family antitoxin domain-containing protein n=1 Tax=Halomonas sp. DP8Y7-3 TaxID=2859079 RepID=UPI001C93EDB0|nr:type IV toxin-antitoxin system AbiEi family antitoxin domain-containing protein [Halomonas sp. DP8Y7-3]MBY5928224.1 type IV toxin-antitoxin system AbiEi family antitoxin [Halomonas sp. DP8Y7-3]
MSAHKSEKLKRILDAVPPGFIVDSGWLERHEVSRFLARKYVDRGWLERVTRGVFLRPAPDTGKLHALDWKTCLLSMQHIMAYDAHVGGMAALALQGYSHYLPLGGNAQVWVYGEEIPSWLTRLQLNASLKTRTTSLFSDPSLGLTNDESDTPRALPWDWQLKTSSPERAILEVMDELPVNESFHNLDMVFESLTTLRPRTLSALLHSCRKIKVTRLFFVFADRHNHPWRKRLDRQEFNLGSGDRALVTGGKIHPRYRIMVPEEFAITEAADGA